MSDVLTLARATPLGPYVPATEAMLTGWCGPVLVDIDGILVPGSLIGPDTRPEAERAGPWTVYPRDDDWPDLHDAYKLARSCRTEDVRLDTRQPEVRDRLVRLGLLPHALRDHPGAAVAAGMGVVAIGPMPRWARHSGNFERVGYLTATLTPDGWSVVSHRVGDPRPVARGPETGPAGKLAADLAALRLGCVLEEPDGWYIPLPDGGVGFVTKKAPNAV